MTVVGWDRERKYKSQEETILLQNGQVLPIVRFGIPAVYGGGIKKTLKALRTFQRRLKSWLKTHKDNFDIIHAFDFDTGFVAKGIAKKYKKKLIYHILDFYVDSHPSGGRIVRNIVKKAEWSVINFAHTTILCTEKRKEQIVGSKPKKLVVIHNTPKMIEGNILDREKAPLKSIKIVYVGIFGEGRLLPELLEVVSENPCFELHIGGFGGLENLIRNFANTNENIFYYGKMAYKDVIELESNCDIMTAIYDPQVLNHKYAAPNKFYESLMLGKPLIMVKDTGWDEIVEKNRIGCLIDYDKEGLKEGLYKVKELLNDQELRERSQNLYLQEYSWDLMKKRIVTLYGELGE